MPRSAPSQLYMRCNCKYCSALYNLYYIILMNPSVLWRCWLGGRKGIRPVKKRVVGCWRGYLPGARCRLAIDPADATATHSLASVKSRLVLPFWYRLTWVVPEKGPLNGCVRACVRACVRVRACVCVCDESKIQSLFSYFLSISVKNLFHLIFYGYNISLIHLQISKKKSNTTSNCASHLLSKYE